MPRIEIHTVPIDEELVRQKGTSSHADVLDSVLALDDIHRYSLYRYVQNGRPDVAWLGLNDIVGSGLVGMANAIEDSLNVAVGNKLRSANAALRVDEHGTSRASQISITSHQGGQLCTFQECLLQHLQRGVHAISRVTPHLTCNYTVQDTVEYVGRLAAMGVKSVLAVGGDKPRHIPHFRRDSALRCGWDLVKLIADANCSLPSPLYIYAALNQYRKGRQEFDRCKRKKKMGAHAFISQPIDMYDTASMHRLLRLRDELKVPVVFSLFYTTNTNTIDRLVQYGARISDITRRRFSGMDRKAGIEEGVLHMAEQYSFLRQLAPDSDINIMGPSKMGIVDRALTLAGYSSLVPVMMDAQKKKDVFPSAPAIRKYTGDQNSYRNIMSR